MRYLVILNMFLLNKPRAHFYNEQETRDINLYNFPSFFGSHFRGHDILKSTQDKSGEAGNHKDHVQTVRIKVGKLSCWSLCWGVTECIFILLKWEGSEERGRRDGSSSESYSVLSSQFSSDIVANTTHWIHTRYSIFPSAVFWGPEKGNRERTCWYFCSF